MRFVFVDRILELRAGKFIKAEHYVSADQDFFRDHFPGFPVVPGVLLTEMMAQTAGKCLDAEGTRTTKAMLTQIRSASFRQWVRPGKTAIITAQIRANRSRYATAACSIEVNGTTVCAADLLFSFVPQETFAPGYRDEVLESFRATQQLETNKVGE